VPTHVPPRRTWRMLWVCSVLANYEKEHEQLLVLVDWKNCPAGRKNCPGKTGEKARYSGNNSATRATIDKRICIRERPRDELSHTHIRLWLGSLSYCSSKIDTGDDAFYP
jgi:hypothetical protein